MALKEGKGPVFVVRNPLVPDVRFEWHPLSKAVYMLHVGVTPEVGILICSDIESEGEAYKVVQIWSHGYREGRSVEKLFKMPSFMA